MDGGFVTAAQRLCKYSVVGSHYPHQLPQKLTRRSDHAAEAPKKKKKKKINDANTSPGWFFSILQQAGEIKAKTPTVENAQRTAV